VRIVSPLRKSRLRPLYGRNKRCRGCKYPPQIITGFSRGRLQTVMRRNIATNDANAIERYAADLLG
jgi:hypothetical protein